jgi:hypothetical protein
MFKLFKIFIGILGYGLLFSLLIFSIFPLKTQAKPKLELSKLSTCIESTDILEKVKDELRKNGIGDISNLDQFKNIQNLDELKNMNVEGVDNLDEVIPQQDTQPNLSEEGGIPSPEDIFGQIDKAGEQIGNVFGSKSTTKTEYCVLSDKSSDVLKNIENSLATKSMDFTYGDSSEILKSIGRIPFIQIPQAASEVKALIAKSSYCNRPLNYSDIYVFYPVETNDIKAVVMFNIELSENTNAERERKIMGNLMQSGQYIKSKLYCHGS